MHEVHKKGPFFLPAFLKRTSRQPSAGKTLFAQEHKLFGCKGSLIALSCKGRKKLNAYQLKSLILFLVLKGTALHF